MSRNFLIVMSILFQIYSEISSNETLQRVKGALESSHKDYLGETIVLVWKFVTLPNPLIVCQSKKFDPQIHDPEHGHWDSKYKNDLELIYIRPVVYRDHEGVLACKGWVANTTTTQQRKWSNCSPS